jgi:hypothetical protein
MAPRTDFIFRQALSTLLIEIFDGPPGREAYLLNQGDPGLLKQIESLSAELVSNRPIPGKTTVAAHVDHLNYGLSLLNRWAAGEPNPWKDADWNASWQRKVVTEKQWKELCAQLRKSAANWQEAVGNLGDWDAISAAGALASAAHTAYHLGAIRQILAAMRSNDAPQG